MKSQSAGDAVGVIVPPTIVNRPADAAAPLCLEHQVSSSGQCSTGAAGQFRGEGEAFNSSVQY